MKILKKYKILIGVLGVVLILMIVFLSKSSQPKVPETPQTPVSPFLITPEEKPTPSVAPVTQTLTPEEIEQLTQGDVGFSDSVNNVLKDYPWYTKLPIETPGYRIVFDLAKKSFRIRLKISPDFPKAQQDSLVAQAIQAAKDKGIDIGTNYYILFGN